MATVKGGFFAQYSGTYTPDKSGKSAARRYAAKFLDRLKVLQELALELNGAAAGQAALVTYKRIQASAELGGKRIVETVTPLSRNTAAADETAIDEDLLTYGGIDTTPVINLDRNPLGTR